MLATHTKLDTLIEGNIENAKQMRAENLVRSGQRAYQSALGFLRGTARKVAIAKAARPPTRARACSIMSVAEATNQDLPVELFPRDKLLRGKN